MTELAKRCKPSKVAAEPAKRCKSGKAAGVESGVEGRHAIHGQRLGDEAGRDRRHKKHERAIESAPAYLRGAILAGLPNKRVEPRVQ